MLFVLLLAVLELSWLHESATTSCQIPKDGGSGKCITCYPGNEIDDDHCYACSVGQYSYFGILCRPCSEGTFANETGQALCYSCNAGTFQDAVGMSSCKSCNIGEYSLAYASSCTACPVGTYQNLSAQSSCNACPAGTYNNAVSKTSLSDCLPCPVNSTGGQGASACNCSSSYYFDGSQCISNVLQLYA